MFFSLESYFIYILFGLPALLLGLWAQWRVQKVFNEQSQARTLSGYTGAQIARRILDANGLYQVNVEREQGFLSDHYDPQHKVLRLSPQVYDSNSVAAAGIAAHEAGHALQDKVGYWFLQVRSAMVPTVQIGSWLGPLVFMGGLLFAGVLGTSVAWLGVMLFAATAAFAVLTLPVEFDASKRAKELLIAQGLVGQYEIGGVSKVLDAAALTYVAGAASAISTLLYYAFTLMGLQGSEE